MYVPITYLSVNEVVESLQELDAGTLSAAA